MNYDLRRVMRKKTIASKKKVNIIKTFTDAQGLGIDKTKTMGIRTSPKLLEEFIRYASLPKKGGKYEFRDIVLNFEEQKIWYASKSKDPYYIKSFGFANEGYFEELWGKGSVNISVKKFLKHLSFLKKYEKIIFYANPETNIIFMQDIEEGKEDVFNQKFDLEHTYTATTLPKLGADYMPIPVNGRGNYIFGGEIDAKILKQIDRVGRGFRQNQYKMTMSPECTFVTFNDMTNPVYGAGEITLVPTSGTTLNTPEQETIRFGNLFSMEGPAKNFEGPIEFRISELNNTPLYLLKKREGGLSIAGVLLPMRIEE